MGQPSHVQCAIRTERIRAPETELENTVAVYPERRSGRLTGVWIAEVMHLGKRRRDRFPTKYEAERWADITKITGAPPEEPKALVVAHSFGDVAKEALQDYQGWEKRRDPSREQRLTYVIDVIGKDKPVADVDDADFDKLVADLKRRPGYHGQKRLSAATINRYLATASVVCRFAKRKKYRKDVPDVPWQKEDGQRIHWLTEAQEAAVRASMLKRRQRDEELTTRVLTATGMRWGEYETLEPRQVHIEGDEAWVKLDKTKTDTPRDIPIDPQLATELVGLLKSSTGVPGYHTFHKSLADAAKSAGQNISLTPHILRHTTATRLVRAGVNLAIVQKFMGHSSIKTTLRYTHVAADDLQQALKKLSPHAGQSGNGTYPEAVETPENQGFLEDAEAETHGPSD